MPAFSDYILLSNDGIDAEFMPSRRKLAVVLGRILNLGLFSIFVVSVGINIYYISKGSCVLPPKDCNWQRTYCKPSLLAFTNFLRTELTS